MLKRVSSSPSTSVSAAPVWVMTVFNALSQSVSNFVAYVAAATNPAPNALAAAAAFSPKSPRVSFRLPAFSCAFCKSSPDSWDESPNCFTAFSVSAAAVSKSLISKVVRSISRFTALYCSSDASPFLNCSCTWASAVFKISNFSFASEIALASKVCFCANASVFLGSNFKSLFVSLNSACVSRILPFTPCSAF